MVRMSAYRFCRTDDIGLLVDALNRCGNDPPMTPAAFKRSIRDLQVWCSSCMVAFAGSDTIGVLIGAKRPTATLVHRIAVHPDHRRQGHGRHLLASLGSKLAILGPLRIVAEVPETLDAARGLFTASGYVEEAVLTDYVWEGEENHTPEPANERQRGSHASGVGNRGPASERVGGSGGAKPPGLNDARFVIPITIDDLAANGLLGEARPQDCWERAVETLAARKDDIAGLAVASDERIEACVLYVRPGAGPEAKILGLRSFVEDGGACLAQLVSQLRAGGMGTFRFPKVHPAEISKECLEQLGFRPAGRYRLYAARARAD